MIFIAEMGNCKPPVSYANGTGSSEALFELVIAVIVAMPQR